MILMAYPFVLKLFIVAAGLQVIFLFFFFFPELKLLILFQKRRLVCLYVRDRLVICLNICPKSELCRAFRIGERGRN